MSDGCHPFVTVLGILSPQLQRLLVLMVEVNGEVMLGGETGRLLLPHTGPLEKHFTVHHRSLHLKKKS